MSTIGTGTLPNIGEQFMGSSTTNLMAAIYLLTEVMTYYAQKYSQFTFGQENEALTSYMMTEKIQTYGMMSVRLVYNPHDNPTSHQQYRRFEFSTLCGLSH